MMTTIPDHDWHQMGNLTKVLYLKLKELGETVVSDMTNYDLAWHCGCSERALLRAKKELRGVGVTPAMKRRYEVQHEETIATQSA